MKPKIKIIRRLLKQSAFPAGVGLVYTAFRHWPIEITVNPAELMESFFASFFLASWFTGQVIRTSKQVYVEEKFDNISSKLDRFDSKSLDAMKLAAKDHIDLAADFASLRAAVKMLVPEPIKGMIYAVHLEQNEDPDATYVKPWQVSDEALTSSKAAILAAKNRAQGENHEV